MAERPQQAEGALRQRLDSSIWDRGGRIPEGRVRRACPILTTVPERALGSLPRVALSSAQPKVDCCVLTPPSIGDRIRR